MPHTELNSKAEFDQALQTQGKYVLIYAYEGSVDPKADEYADKYAGTTAAYKVDVSKHEAAKQYFNVTKTPMAIVFKDGKEVKKSEDMSPSGMEEIASMLT